VELLGSPFTLFCVSAADHHAGRSLSRESPGDCQPEALRGSGNDRDSGPVPQEKVITHASSPRSYILVQRRGLTGAMPQRPLPDKPLAGINSYHDLLLSKRSPSIRRLTFTRQARQSRGI
jgi:hypothetical protein